MADIVVGVDESQGAAHALRWAADEATFHDARVVAVLAWGYLDQHRAGTDATFDPGYGEADAKEAVDRIVSSVLGAGRARDVELRTPCDLPADALLDASIGAELLVVGARGLGGFRGLLLGSVSERCLHHAVVPTVVVRGDGPVGRSGVVVGVDGSPGATTALRWAVDEARRRGSPLTVVHAYQAPVIWYSYAMAAAPALLRSEAEVVLGEALADVDTTGLELHRVLASGGAASGLLAAAEGADLLVVGSRGHGAVRRAVLGSVATQVARHAPCPVAVVPEVR